MAGFMFENHPLSPITPPAIPVLVVAAAKCLPTVGAYGASRSLETVEIAD